MKLRKETRISKQKFLTQDGEVVRDVETEMTIFDLACHCGSKGGEVAFTAAQVAMNGGEDALEAKLNAEYLTICDEHCCVTSICTKHAMRDQLGRIIEPRVSVHPDPKFHHTS
jgi:hypothetical protein